MRSLVRFALLVLCVAHAGSAWGGTYTIDPDHTSVSFKVRHLFTWVQGSFNEFEGTIDYDPEHPEALRASATIQAASIDTGSAERDKHLRTSDFFHTDEFPTLSFKTVEVEGVSGSRAKLHGLLTIRGIERAVVLDVDVLGTAQDPWGNVHAGFSAEGTVHRKDFGLTWNQTLETGGVLVGEEVRIILDVSGILAE